MAAMTRARTTIGSCAIALVLLAGCASDGATPDASAAVRVEPGADPVDMPGLEHVAELAPGLISGGEPVGETGYQTLRAMGVKTVVSVDGVAPPADLARSVGIRVVHLPIGYDGVPQETVLAMAKALTELEGPVYVHCHHGKHRGPAALVAGAVCAGAIDRDTALAFMEKAGTSRSYDGLWADVASAEPADPLELALLDADLPERADVGGYAGAMSLISRAHDRVVLVMNNAWAVPADHPDLAPASDLGLVHDLLRSLRDDPDALAMGAAHAEILERSVEEALAAETAFTRGDLPGATASFKALAASCKACHVAYRD